MTKEPAQTVLGDVNNRAPHAVNPGGQPSTQLLTHLPLQGMEEEEGKNESKKNPGVEIKYKL